VIVSGDHFVTLQISELPSNVFVYKFVLMQDRRCQILETVCHLALLAMTERHKQPVAICA
jgi:hypothetical protein